LGAHRLRFPGQFSPFSEQAAQRQVVSHFAGLTRANRLVWARRYAAPQAGNRRTEAKAREAHLTANRRVSPQTAEYVAGPHTQTLAIAGDYI
jgi:hypothetical protein